HRARSLILGAGALAVVLAIALALLITRSLTAPIRQTVGLLRSLATGDLSVRLHDSAADEIGQMRAALDESLDPLTVAAARRRRALRSQAQRPRSRGVPPALTASAAGRASVSVCPGRSSSSS